MCNTNNHRLIFLINYTKNVVSWVMFLMKWGNIISQYPNGKDFFLSLGLERFLKMWIKKMLDIDFQTGYLKVMVLTEEK